MTHYPDIHARAEALVRQSNGRLTKRDAYRELARRSQIKRRNNRVTVNPQDPAIAAVEFPKHHDWQMRADLQ